MDGSSTYQKLGSPQCSELNGREAVIAGSACGEPQEGPSVPQRGRRTRSLCSPITTVHTAAQMPRPGGGKVTQQFATWVRKVVGRPPAYSYAALMITPLPASVSSLVPSAPQAAPGEVGFTEHRNRAETQAGVQKALNHTCISRPTSGVCHYFCRTLLPI